MLSEMKKGIKMRQSGTPMPIRSGTQMPTKYTHRRILKRDGSETSYQEKQRTLIFQDENLRHGFAQVPNVVLRDPSLSGNEKMLFALLLSYAWQNEECFPGQDTLAHDMGLKPRAIRQLLVKLKAKRLIGWKRQGLGKVNIYHINRLSDAYPLFIDKP